MQYKQETEKVAMMDSSYMAVPKPLSLVEDREVQRTRKILIIILGVCLVSVFWLLLYGEKKASFLLVRNLCQLVLEKNLPLLDVLHIQLLGSLCGRFG
jgi:hypothetical protein